MTKTHNFLPTWLSANDLASYLGVSKRTIRRWHAQGRLPPPYHFTRRTLRWLREDITILIHIGPAAAGSFPRRRAQKKH